ncbi:G-protein coupled receptor Mth2 isoform X2 [Cephus cinctus]|uniref:G-protein coupled receptor Mth2 isoform X2 n=1 Tax=Cephus cinctus TaxID=211228 RepID=A0AAJ7BZE9_CEPCN|nr:G-protein coupled receptor Mth2 isoform X2 [Cephus cinctus]
MSYFHGLPLSHFIIFGIFFLIDLNTNFVQGSSSKSLTILSFPLNESISQEYSRLPLVGKCCPVGQIMTKDEKGTSLCVDPIILPSLIEPEEAMTTSSPSSLPEKIFSPYFNDFNRTGLLDPGHKKDKFVALVGDPCQYGKYILEPEQSSEDEYYLLLNGSVYLPLPMPVMLVPRQDYCMDIIPGQGLRVLVCFPKEPEVVRADVKIVFYAFGLLISAVFLVTTIVLYCITSKLMDIYGKALCHYCACLALALTTFAITQLASSHLSDQACVSIAFVIQFSFVACFFWLNVICIETWLMVKRHVKHGSCRRSTESKRLFFYYSVWSWGPAMILILICMTLKLNPTVPSSYVKPQFGAHGCWFESDRDAMPYFYVPLGLLLLANSVLFVMTAVSIARYQKDIDLRLLARNQEADREEQRLFKRLKRTFIVCIILFLHMSLNWVMELISWCTGSDSFAWSAFDLVNALQGVLVFGLFVLRRPARDLIWYRIQKIRGIDALEPEADHTDLGLLPITTDPVPPQRMTQ